MGEQPALDDTTAGAWLVDTMASTYLLDLDHRTITRRPHLDEPHTTPAAPTRADLADDETPIALVQLVQCVIGQPLVLLLDLHGEGVDTIRVSTAVTAIRPAHGQAAAAAGAAGVAGAGPDAASQARERRAGRNQPSRGTDPENSTEEPRPGRAHAANAAPRPVRGQDGTTGGDTATPRPRTERDQLRSRRSCRAHEGDAQAARPDVPKWAAAVGPVWTTDEIAVELDVPPDTVHTLTEQHRLLELLTQDGHRLYPTWQVRDGQTLPGLDRMLQLLEPRVVDPWTLAAWVHLPQPDLGDRSLAAALAEDGPTSAIERICHRAYTRWFR